MSEPKRRRAFDEFDALTDEPAPASGRGSAFAEFDQLMAEPDEAFEPARAAGSHVIEMPEQEIVGDPYADMNPIERLGAFFRDTPVPEGMQAARERPGILSEKGAANIRSGAPALVAGATHGLTSGLADDAAGLVSPSAGEAVRGYWKGQQEAEPGPFMAGDVAGMVAQPNAIAVRGAGIIPKAIEAGVNAGVATGSRAYGDSEEQDPQARLMEALDAARQPALIAGGGSGALGVAQKALGAGANVARRFAVGGTQKQYGDIVDEMGTREGLDYLNQNLGRIPDEQGLTNRLLPQSKAGYARKAAARAEDVEGPRIGASLKQAANEIPPTAIQRSAVEQPIVQRADRLEKAARPGWKESDQALAQAQAAPLDTPTDLARLKREFENEAYAKGAVGGSGEDLYAKGQAQAASSTRNHLREVMAQARPETNAAFTDASANYADTKLIENMAKKGAIQDIAAPIVGGTLGAGAGYYYGRDKESIAKGAVVGTLAGKYGPDLTANVLRLGEQGSRALGENASSLARLGAYLEEERRRALEEQGAR